MNMQQNREIAGVAASPGRGTFGGWAVLGLCLFTFVGAALLCGCGEKASNPAAMEETLPEAVAVREAFASAPPAFRNPVEEALALVRAGKVNPAAYSEALPQLRMLASNANLSAGQKQVLGSLIQNLQAELATGRPRQNAPHQP
jgi:hypothetical protein